jgi:hypothetical protein
VIDPADSGPATPEPPPKDGGGGRGWMLATVGLVAALVGLGIGLLVSSGGDTTTRTVRAGTTRTVTAPGTATSLGVTVTAPERTVVQTVTETETETVTVPGETAGE